MATLDVSAVDDQEKYSDGPSEQKLLELFNERDVDSRIAELLGEDVEWELLYHLSPRRRRLLDWYPFKTDARLLEVGAGCGALTGLFAERVAHVTAVELTKQRAELVTLRHRERKNVDVFAGNLTRLKFAAQFDYVSCVGVLEYAGRFVTAPNPYLRLLEMLRAQLSNDGVLILAIENRFGLKYWAGAREDHTGRHFDSLSGYPWHDGVRTFGRSELIELLKSAGFNRHEFYYPMPDYKFPEEIFSDRYRPAAQHGVKPSLFPSPDMSKARDYLFDEKLVIDGLTENNLFPDFANSFLVFASGAR